MAVEGETPDPLGRDRVIRREPAHEHHTTAEEINLELSQGTDVGLCAHHALQRHCARNPESTRHGQRQCDVLFMLEIAEALDLLVPYRVDLVLPDDDELAVAVEASVFEDRKVLPLGRKQLPAHRRGASQGQRHVAHARAHHVEVIGPGIADHSMGRADHLQLADGLQARLKRHALEYDRLCALPRGDADDSQLLEHARTARTIDGELGFVGGNQTG